MYHRIIITHVEFGELCKTQWREGTEVDVKNAGFEILEDIRKSVNGESSACLFKLDNMGETLCIPSTLLKACTCRIQVTHEVKPGGKYKTLKGEPIES